MVVRILLWMRTRNSGIVPATCETVSIWNAGRAKERRFRVRVKEAPTYRPKFDENLRANYQRHKSRYADEMYFNKFGRTLKN